MINRNARSILLAGVVATLPLTGLGAAVEGTVLDENGAPLAGVMLTHTREDGLYAETVYSNADGAFSLNSNQANTITLRARLLNYADSHATVDAPDGNTVGLSIRLNSLKTPHRRAKALTASAYVSRLEFADPAAEGFFRIECLTCHQLGNPLTRAVRSEAEWTQVVDRMLGYWGIADPDWTARYVAILNRGFDGMAPAITQSQATDPEIFGARIRQWKLPTGMIAHDVERHSRDGKFYTVDQGLDLIYITDPVTNDTETFSIPSGGIPMGGKFLRTMGIANPLGLSVSRGPHSLQEGPDGKFYTTDTVSGQVGVFDPAERTYIGHDVGGRAMYPHTLRFAADGMLWLTVSMSNQVARFNPRTGEMARIDLPPTSDRPDVPLYLPYGIDIHPNDGSVWYSRLMANRIGRIDPETLEVTEFEPPTMGPRRMRFSRDGTLWIPSYGDGYLVRLDTETMQFTRVRIPTLSAEEIEAPYAVGIHPVTQDVWITANMSDRAFRYIPAQDRFIAYPLPTRGIFLRDMVFTPDGEVCAASSMTPAALAVEGGMEEVICIDP